MLLSCLRRSKQRGLILDWRNELVILFYGLSIISLIIIKSSLRVCAVLGQVFPAGYYSPQCTCVIPLQLTI